MVTQSPTIRALDETKWPLVEVNVFKCCMDTDGTYLGAPWVHDPDLPGDGPWFLVVTQKGVSTTFGYGTKSAALDALKSLTRYAERRYEIEVDQWD